MRCESSVLNPARYREASAKLTAKISIPDRRAG